MNLTDDGVDTGVSEMWVNCNAVIDTPTPGSNVRSATVYIGGLDKPGACVQFTWNYQDIRLQAGERHVMAFVQSGKRGTLRLKQISIGGRTVDVFATS